MAKQPPANPKASVITQDTVDYPAADDDEPTSQMFGPTGDPFEDATTQEIRLATKPGAAP